MAVQLIIGKTFCQAKEIHTGREEAGADAIKRVRVGQLVLIKGHVNLCHRSSLKNWASKRSLDIVVSDYSRLEGPIDADSFVTKSLSNAPQQKRFQKAPKAMRMENYLTITDVFATVSPEVCIVHSIEGIQDFAKHVRLSLTTLNRGDSNVAPTLAGLDCEWKPTSLVSCPELPRPVLLLQISLHRLGKVYLFDLQSLLRPCLDPAHAMDDVEEKFSDALKTFFESHKILKVGFHLDTDLIRLAGSYPHIPAFRSFNSVLEVSTVAQEALLQSKISNAKQITNSLSSLTKFLLLKALDKEMQVSDWSERPLSRAQVEYGALDAAVTPALLEKSLDMAGAVWLDEKRLGRHEEDESFSKAVMCMRCLFLDSTGPHAVEKLRAKAIVSKHNLVVQRWRAGSATPRAPSVPADESSGFYIDIHGNRRISSISLSLQKTLANSVSSLLGTRVGQSKEDCLEALLKNRNGFPSDAKLEFPGRSGYVEFDDLVALFVNTPIHPVQDRSRKGYPNLWLEDGRLLTWYLRKSDWDHGNSRIARKLLGNRDSSDGVPSPATTILFARTPHGSFLCCGRCRVVPAGANQYVDSASDWNLIEFHLELSDWPYLKFIPDFASMVMPIKSNQNNSPRTIDDKSSPRVKTGDASPQSLARMIHDGNVVGALALAIANETPNQRSLQNGLSRLIKMLESCPTDQYVQSALALVVSSVKGASSVVTETQSK